MSAPLAIGEEFLQTFRYIDVGQGELGPHLAPAEAGLRVQGEEGDPALFIDHVPLDCHVGSIAVRRLIEQKQPLITLHGHIHESAKRMGSWRDKIGETHLFSAAHHGPELALVRFDPAAPTHAPNALGNQSATPFPDAAGNLWVEPDGNDGWQLTAEAVSRGYDLVTEYLFCLYDDQGPAWDFGGPEGAMTGFLRPVPERRCGVTGCSLSRRRDLPGCATAHCPKTRRGRGQPKSRVG